MLSSRTKVFPVPRYHFFDRKASVEESLVRGRAAFLLLCGPSY